MEGDTCNMVVTGAAIDWSPCSPIVVAAAAAVLPRSLSVYACATLHLGCCCCSSVTCDVRALLISFINRQKQKQEKNQTRSRKGFCQMAAAILRKSLSRRHSLSALSLSCRKILWLLDTLYSILIECVVGDGNYHLHCIHREKCGDN